MEMLHLLLLSFTFYLANELIDATYVLVKNDSSVLINYDGSWRTCFLKDAGAFIVQMMQFISDSHILKYLQLFNQGTYWSMLFLYC
jgi:hypothetical protein